MSSVGVSRIRMLSIRRGLLTLTFISLLESSMVSCEPQTNDLNGQNDDIPISNTTSTDALSETDKFKKSSLISSPGAGVISSYLAGVGAQSLVNNNLRLRTSTSTASPPRFQQRPQPSIGHTPNTGNGYTRKPRPTTTPRLQNPPDYVESSEVIREVQTPPPRPYTPPPRRQVVVQNQRLSYEQYLQILQEKHKEEEQKLEQSKTTRKPIPVQQTTRDPYYYEYEMDTRDKKPSSVAPVKINQPNRITTSSVNHKFPTQQEQQQILAAAGIQQKPEDYDIDYLDSPKTTTPAVVSNANNQNQGVGNSPLSQLQNPLGQFQQGQNGFPNPLQQFPNVNTVDPLQYQLQLAQLQRLQQLQYLLQLQQLQQQTQALAQAQAQITTPGTWEYITPAGIFINPRLEPTKIPSSTHNPENSIQNIGGLFGSLAVGDLAGVVDNSLRLYQNGVFENLNHLTSCGFKGCTPGAEDEDGNTKTGGFGSVLAGGNKKIPHPPQDRYPG